ncbi:MAG: hypothetical protein SPJ69_00355 [Campylobacter sp.]|uniref:hypothetical protein n=1 Tax=Campylobacter sp. TaxID=205 RepID=UPI0029707389|nr:hypothetical protein [Campylobacter sp.]MDD7599266.1 hypothetical protein [Campylobacteraceae bacterium]MDY5886754.1 hypothetical protein [Campylobacter sp.]
MQAYRYRTAFIKGSIYALRLKEKCAKKLKNSLKLLQECYSKREFSFLKVKIC